MKRDYSSWSWIILILTIGVIFGFSICYTFVVDRDKEIRFLENRKMALEDEVKELNDKWQRTTDDICGETVSLVDNSCPEVTPEIIYKTITKECECEENICPECKKCDYSSFESIITCLRKYQCGGWGSCE